MTTSETERAECPTCHMAVEGPSPATLVCDCGTALSIHGGGLPSVSAQHPPDPGRLRAAGISGVLSGGRNYA